MPHGLQGIDKRDYEQPPKVGSRIEVWRVPGRYKAARVLESNDTKLVLRFDDGDWDELKISDIKYRKLSYIKRSKILTFINPHTETTYKLHPDDTVSKRIKSANLRQTITTGDTKMPMMHASVPGERTDVFAPPSHKRSMQPVNSSSASSSGTSAAVANESAKRSRPEAAPSMTWQSSANNGAGNLLGSAKPLTPSQDTAATSEDDLDKIEKKLAELKKTQESLLKSMQQAQLEAENLTKLKEQKVLVQNARSKIVKLEESLALFEPLLAKAEELRNNWTTAQTNFKNAKSELSAVIGTETNWDQFYRKQQEAVSQGFFPAWKKRERAVLKLSTECTSLSDMIESEAKNVRAAIRDSQTNGNSSSSASSASPAASSLKNTP